MKGKLDIASTVKKQVRRKPFLLDVDKQFEDTKTLNHPTTSDSALRTASVKALKDSKPSIQPSVSLDVSSSTLKSAILLKRKPNNAPHDNSSTTQKGTKRPALSPPLIPTRPRTPSPPEVDDDLALPMDDCAESFHEHENLGNFSSTVQLNGDASSESSAKQMPFQAGPAGVVAGHSWRKSKTLDTKAPGKNGVPLAEKLRVSRVDLAVQPSSFVDKLSVLKCSHHTSQSTQPEPNEAENACQDCAVEPDLWASTMQTEEELPKAKKAKLDAVQQKPSSAKQSVSSAKFGGWTQVDEDEEEIDNKYSKKYSTNATNDDDSSEINSRSGSSTGEDGVVAA
jgi:hypothetical protein